MSETAYNMHHSENHEFENHHHDHGQLQQHSTPARKLVFAKGIVDIFLSLSLIFFPSFFFDGLFTSAIYKLTGMPAASWAQDPSGAVSLAALIMGCGFAGITAGQSQSNDAYRVVAALNGSFALTGFLICFFSPHKYGTAFLLLISLQDIIWYAVIVHYGSFGAIDSLGLSTRGLYVLEERLSRDVLKQKSENERRQVDAHQEKRETSYVQ